MPLGRRLVGNSAPASEKIFEGVKEPATWHNIETEQHKKRAVELSHQERQLHMIVADATESNPP